jgi:anti-sigma B factor antagonist
MTVHHSSASTSTVTLRGEIDIRNRRDITEQVQRAIAARSTRIRLDLSQVTFLDSSGLGAIIAAWHAAAAHGARLTVSAMSDKVRRLLEMTDTLSLLAQAEGDADPDGHNSGTDQSHRASVDAV